MGRGNIKDFNKPTLNGPHKQGYYKLKNPIKYISKDKRIIYRSSLEYKFCKLCDEDPKILEWGSEIIRIPYTMKVKDVKTGQVSTKTYGYWPDYLIKIQCNDGTRKKYLIEVKAGAFLVDPEKPSKNATRQKKKSYIKKKKIYLTNKAKCLAAIEWCSKQTQIIEYKFLTESFFRGI